jgi:hypothetical protein
MVAKVFPACAVPDLANGTSPVWQGPLYRAVRGRSGVCMRPPPVKTASSRPAVMETGPNRVLPFEIPVQPCHQARRNAFYDRKFNLTTDARLAGDQ